MFMSEFLEPVNMLPYLANQGTGLLVVKIRQEKQWSMVHWSCLERFTPWKSSNATPDNYPPHLPENPMLSIYQHMISWFATSQTSLILTGSLILTQAINIRGTSYYTNSFLMKNISILIISPNPYSHSGKMTPLFTLYKQGEVQKNELIVHNYTM